MVKNDYELANSSEPDGQGRTDGAVPSSAKGWRRSCLGCARWVWLLLLVLVTVILLVLLAAWFIVLHVRNNLVYPPDASKLYMNKSHSVEGDMLYYSSNNLSTPVLWPGGKVPYIIEDAIGCPTSSRCHIVNSAINELNNRTCLEMLPANGSSDALVISLTPGHGCAATVGYQEGDNATRLLQLDYGCFDTAFVLHLLGHSIGFWHEHNRPDRDEIIEINETSVDTEMYGRNVFKKYSQLPHGDASASNLESVMMLGPDAFSNGEGDTLIPKDANSTDLTALWKRSKLSEADVTRINTVYEQECAKDSSA